MPIFKRFVETYSDLVPTILRRKAKNVLNLALQQFFAAQDAVAEALDEYIEGGWPLPTARGWVLDQHWGPYLNLQRNGNTDAEYRVYLRAKKLLNRSWGAADQALQIFQLILPTATLTFTPAYPKHWLVNIFGVDLAEAGKAIEFMRKYPSPLGGGFSVCGDNGFAVASDAKVFSYSSVYGTEGVEYDVTGWFSSVYGDPGSDTAGWAHLAQI